MLEVIPFNHRSSVEKFFQQLDVKNQTWIISNLKTKVDLQKQMLQRESYFLNSSIVRIKDFWTQLFNHQFSDFSIISNETFTILVREILTRYQDQIQLSIIDYKKKSRDLNYFANLILDQSFDINSDRFKDWFEEFERRKYQLKSELLVDKLIAGILLKQKTVPFEWITVLLQNKNLDLSFIYQDRIYFDLGSELSIKEAELLYQISKTKRVTVFEPDYLFIERYKYLLKPYEYLNGLVDKQHPKQHPKDIFSSSEIKPTVTLRKFTNSIAECRDVVGQVKEWISHGVDPAQIQVLAPRVEEYWPILEPLFKLEGVPVQKDVTIKIINLPSIQRLKAKINFFRKQASAADLEKIIFLGSNLPKMKDSIFKNNFSSPFLTYTELIDKIKKLIPEWWQQELGKYMDSADLNLYLNQHLNFEQFLILFSDLFEKELDRDLFEFLIPELMKAATTNVILSVAAWLDWLTIILLRLEIKSDTHQDGIRVDNVTSSLSFNSDYVYVFAADDKYFGNQHDFNIEPQDILSLANDLGFYLDHPDFNYSAFELEALLEKSNREIVLSYSQNDIHGEITNPCLMWQKLAFEQKILEKSPDIHKTTQWDRTLLINPTHFLSYSVSDFNPEVYEPEVYEKDEKLERYSEIKILKEVNLSPSSLKNFSDCSFKFFMEKQLGMSEVELEELDLSNRRKGLWYHDLFEKIISKDDLFIKFWQVHKPSSERIRFLKEIFQDQIPEVISRDFWNKINNKYYLAICKFIDHHILLQQSFPHVKNIGCELKWKTYFDLATKQWSKEKPRQGFLIRGTIDRVLLNTKTQKAWVIDYKLGSGQAMTHNHWLKQDNWQLLFYTLALEKGWLSGVQHDVELAQYWVINKWEIKKGFVQELNDPILLKSQKNRITADQKEELLMEFEKTIAQVITQLLEKRFIPKPKEETTCQKCDWSLVCRAPHLN